MAIPTVSKVNEFDENLDSAEEFINSTAETFTTHTGLTRETITGVINNAVQRPIVPFSPADPYPDNSLWVEQPPTGGQIYRPKPSALPIAAGPFDSNDWVLSGLNQVDKIYQIPSDYTSLQDAIDNIPASIILSGSSIGLNIESGHLLTSGLKVTNGDYSMFKITSSDAAVGLNAAFVGVDITADERANTVGANSSILFLGVNCVFPEIRCVINMAKTSGLGDGLNLSNSSCLVSAGCGVINASNRGLVVWGNSNIQARESVWDGANDEGIRVQGGCNADLRSASANNCMLDPSFGEAAVYVSRSSVVEFRDGSCTGSGADGLKARRSIVTATNVDCSGANVDSGSACLVVESGAIVEASSCTANNGSRGIWANAGGKAVVDGGTATGNSSVDIFLGTGGQVIGNVETSNSGGGGETDIGDTNISAFNTWFSNGVILNDEAEESIQSGGSGNHQWYKYADGRMVYHVNADTIATGTVATGDYTGLITPPTVSETFTEIHSAHWDAIGRAGSGGTGARIGVHLIGRPNNTTANFKAENTGVQPDSATTGTSIQSIQLQWTIFGLWK